MDEVRKTRLKLVYVFFMGVLVTVTILAVSKAISIWYAGMNAASQENMESARKIREGDGLDSDITRSRSPYVMFRPEANHKIFPVINSFGFHSPEVTKKKEDNEYRIAIVGGSVIFSNGPQSDSGSSNTPNTDLEYLNHSIIGILAKVMKERLPGLRDKKVTFINGGIASGVSGQELAQLMHHIIPLDIDLLVIYDGFNDFFIPFNYDRRPGYPYDYFVEEYRFLKGRGEIGGRDALQYMDRIFNELGIQTLDAEDAKIEILEKYLFNITEMVKVAEGFDIRTGVFLQPYSKRNMNPLLSLGNHHTLKIYQAAQRAFRHLSKKNSSRTIFQDMTYMNDALDGLFLDIGHTWWNPSHQMIAEEIFIHFDAAGMFENLKASSINLPNDQPSPAKSNSSNYYAWIQEALDTAALGLHGTFTEQELIEYADVGYPGIGHLALKAFENYYGGKEFVPSGLKDSIDVTINSGKRLIDKEKDRLGIKGTEDAKLDALKLQETNLTTIRCEGGIALSGGNHKGFLPEMAFDEEETTLWGSAQTGSEVANAAYIGYDFGGGKKHSVRRISIKQGGRLEDIRIQSKIRTGASWNDIPIAVKYVKDTKDIIELVSSPAARYWRLLAASNAGEAPAAWTVYEIQFMEKNN